MTITMLVATRATCIRRKVGAISVLEKKILATGYNGAPRNIKECISKGYCEREKQKIPSGERHELCRGLHAEQNVIIQAAYHGIPIAESTIYCTNKPCVICSKMIINAGIRKICCDQGYDDPLADQMLAEAEIEIARFTP